jgi:hypothetical protein
LFVKERNIVVLYLHSDYSLPFDTPVSKTEHGDPVALITVARGLEHGF